MIITIQGAISVGPSWHDLQTLIRGMLDRDGHLTRIAAREANHFNYRATRGLYDLTFTPDHGDAVAIVLAVN